MVSIISFLSASDISVGDSVAMFRYSVVAVAIANVSVITAA